MLICCSDLNVLASMIISRDRDQDQDQDQDQEKHSDVTEEDNCKLIPSLQSQGTHTHTHTHGLCFFCRSVCVRCVFGKVGAFRLIFTSPSSSKGSDPLLQDQNRHTHRGAEEAAATQTHDRVEQRQEKSCKLWMRKVNVCVQQNISVSLWLTDTVQSLFTWRPFNKHDSELTVQIEECDLDPFHYFLCRFGSKFTFNASKIWTEGISVSTETQNHHIVTSRQSVSQLTYNWWSQTLVLLLSVGPSRPGSGLWNSLMWVCQQVKMCERCSCIYISGCFSLQTIW